MRRRLNQDAPLLPRKTRVLFVCIGNAVRSQMAEGFARTYGNDVLEAYSAGVAPASALAALTKKVMLERGIDLARHFPKSIYEAPGSPWDVVVNMSGAPLPRHILAAPAREWKVRDPISEPAPAFVETAALIESLVMGLILELRSPARRALKPD